ncbi:MAG TPA: PAS domain S-box protein [Ferruginibacter sp.]|nr:PAS domain S-box protein [Ferruginibacter sp.]
MAELNNVFERITDAFIALDNSWRYTYMNSHAEKMHNKKAADLVGKSIWEEFPDLVEQPFYHALMKAKETQESVRIELYYATTDKWFEDLIYPSANGISVYYHDITNRKKAELDLEFNVEKLKISQEELKISIERFELVAKATNDAVWDWDIRANTIWGNDNFRGIFNAAPKSDISFEDFTGRIHPEDRTFVLSNFETALKNKSNFLTEEFSFRINDGTYRNIYDRAYILYNSANEPYRMLGAMQDITEQKLSQQKIQMETEMSDSIINSLPGVFYLASREKFYRWNYNLELVTGYSHDEIQNLIPIALFPDEEKERLREKITGVFKKGEDSVETKFLLKNGETVPYYFTAMRIQYEGETLLMGVGMDISERERSMQRLEESEEKYRTLIEEASDGFFISNQQGELVDVNTSAITLSGYTMDELMGMNIREIILTENTQASPVKIKELLKGEVIVDEKVIMQKSGSPVYVEISSKQLPDGRIQSIARNITARKKAEENIRSSEEMRRLIMNAALDAIICIDTRGLITFWNSQAENIFGWKATDVYDKKLSEVIIPPAFRQRHEAGLRNYLQSGKSEILNVLLELTAVNRENIEFPVEVSILPLRQGGEEFFCAYIRDITARKKAEEEVKSSELKYRLLFNQNPLPMWMITTDDRTFLDVNAAAMAFYGYTKDEFLNMSILDIRPQEEAGRIKKTEFKTPGISDVGIWTHQKKDGTKVRVHIITHDIMYEGKYAKLVLANDVTDRMIAEDKLKKSHEDFRQLATHLENIRESERTHIAREIHDELGQQLTGLKMDISWIKKKLNPADIELNKKMKDTIQLVDTTVKTVRRIATELRPSILDDLGIIAAMEWQTEEFEKRFKIKSAFKSNVANIAISSDYATAIFRIYQESLTNVVRHANASRVNSSLEIKDNILVLNISDNGKGFNATEITNKKTLGLLGMKERTLLMGGTYEISSRDGKGTSVIIIVPLKEQVQQKH